VLTPTAAAKPRLRVLLIEDTAPDAELIVAELEQGGYPVDWLRVETAGAMTRALRDRPWDLPSPDVASIQKPFTPKALILKVRTVLAG
jgi:hypothetical protein